MNCYYYDIDLLLWSLLLLQIRWLNYFFCCLCSLILYAFNVPLKENTKVTCNDFVTSCLLHSLSTPAIVLLWQAGQFVYLRNTWKNLPLSIKNFDFPPSKLFFCRTEALHTFVFAVYVHLGIWANSFLLLNLTTFFSSVTVYSCRRIVGNVVLTFCTFTCGWLSSCDSLFFFYVQMS